jgi:hypothetical protein
VELAALIVGLATLAVALYVARIQMVDRGRAGTASVEVVRHYYRENANTQLGWQLGVEFLNRGPAVAYAAGVWSDRDPSEFSDERTPSIPPGAGASQWFDIPPPGDGGPPHVWVRWRDRRGVQSVDTGILLVPPPAE